MNSVVADSSVLIEFAKRGILPELFKLGYSVTTPDILFNNELLDLGEYGREYLLDLGLDVQRLETTGIAKSASYRSKNPALSIVDSCALALAYDHHKDLLTEDCSMRRAAYREGVFCVGVLEIIQEIRSRSLISNVRYISILKSMLIDPICPVSKPDISQLLNATSILITH